MPAAFFFESESGGIGRRARLRIWWATMGVQIPPLAPINKQDGESIDGNMYMIYNPAS